MSQYKLYYFNYRGRAEPIRLCFAAAGVEYEDIRYQMGGEQWAEKKKAGLSPAGYLPVLELADGRKICESMAVMRYVAREHGLAPDNNFEIAQCDMLVGMVDDLFGKMVKIYREKDEERKKTFQKEFDDTHQPAFMKNVNTLLKANNGGKGFFVGDKLSYGDIVVFNICGAPPLQKVLDNYPELKGHNERIGQIPKIKEWIEKRPKTEG